MRDARTITKWRAVRDTRTFTKWRMVRDACIITDATCVSEGDYTVLSPVFEPAVRFQSVMQKLSFVPFGVSAPILYAPPENTAGALHCIVPHHNSVYLKTSPQSFPKRVLHRVRSSTSSFNFQHLLVSLRPSSSCLPLLLRLAPLLLSFSNFFFKQFLRNM